MKGNHEAPLQLGGIAANEHWFMRVAILKLKLSNMINFKQPHEILNQFKQYENPYDFSNEKIMVRFDDAIKAMVEYADQFKQLQQHSVMQAEGSDVGGAADFNYKFCSPNYAMKHKSLKLNAEGLETMITKIYINENCEPLHNDNSKLSEWEKKQVYAAYANRGLTEEQLKDPEIRWDAGSIDPDVFERVFLKPNSHIQVDLPYELINPKRGGGI